MGDYPCSTKKNALDTMFMVACRVGTYLSLTGTEIAVADLLSDFLDHPEAKTYLALRTALMGSPDYDAMSAVLTDFAILVEAGDHGAVKAAIPLLMPNYLLSPSAHFLIAASAKNAGDTDTEEQEKTMAQACLHGISDTGDGTADAPYRCVHVSDEYDLANARGQAVTTHRSDVLDGRHHDVLVCADGAEIWFDVTETIVAMAEI